MSIASLPGSAQRLIWTYKTLQGEPREKGVMRMRRSLKVSCFCYLILRVSLVLSISISIMRTTSFHAAPDLVLSLSSMTKLGSDEDPRWIYQFRTGCFGA